MKNIFRKISKKAQNVLTYGEKVIIKISAMCFMLLICGQTALADGLESSVIVTGTQKLINSAMNVILVLAPIAGGVIIGYLCIRRGMSDEQEHKMWNKRISIAVVSTIGAVLASVIINVILSYYR